MDLTDPTLFFADSKKKKKKGRSLTIINVDSHVAIVISLVKQ